MRRTVSRSLLHTYMSIAFYFTLICAIIAQLILLIAKHKINAITLFNDAHNKLFKYLFAYDFLFILCLSADL